MSDIHQAFQDAVNTVKNAPEDGSFKPDNDLKLKMYGLFRQAQDGDVSGKKPGMLDVVGRAKYGAWEKLKGTSQDDAMQQYVDMVNGLSEKFG